MSQCRLFETAATSSV